MEGSTLRLPDETDKKEKGRYQLARYSEDTNNFKRICEYSFNSSFISINLLRKYKISKLKGNLSLCSSWLFEERNTKSYNRFHFNGI